MKLIEDWRLAIDKGKFVGVIPTETGKAFEFLLLLHMVRKLQAYNFSDESVTMSLKIIFPRLVKKG